MRVPKRISKFFRDPPRTLFEDREDSTAEAPVRGPLFPNHLFYGLMTLFCLSLMLTADWFGCSSSTRMACSGGSDPSTPCA